MSQVPKESQTKKWQSKVTTHPRKTDHVFWDSGQVGDGRRYVGWAVIWGFTLLGSVGGGAGVEWLVIKFPIREVHQRGFGVVHVVGSLPLRAHHDIRLQGSGSHWAVWGGYTGILLGCSLTGKHSQPTDLLWITKIVNTMIISMKEYHYPLDGSNIWRVAPQKN